MGGRPLSVLTAGRGRLRKLSGEDTTGAPGRRTGAAVPYLGAVTPAAAAAAAAVDAYLGALDGDTRTVAPDQWGFTVEAGGWPLHVGVALRDGLLRAQGEVAGPGQVDPHVLLRWNRDLPFVRFSHTGSGAAWVQADLPLEAVSPQRLDAVLGLLVRVAAQAREAIAASRED